MAIHEFRERSPTDGGMDYPHLGDFCVVFPGIRGHVTRPIPGRNRTGCRRGSASLRQAQPVGDNVLRQSLGTRSQEPGHGMAKRQIAGESAVDQYDPMGTPSFLMPKSWKTPILIALLSTQLRFVLFQARLHIRLYSIVSLISVTDPSQKRKLAPPG
jgi:hypothetical protein